jgi:3-hydroxymyristoyl/3-hydroxydecanoyl-(acyl carrier protein) dehydratase
MFADGKPIVEITDLTLQLGGIAYSELEECWRPIANCKLESPSNLGIGTESATCNRQSEVCNPEATLVFDRRRVLAFAVGKPSDAYGELYKPFDEGRRLARLPAPPYSFLDRVLSTTAEAWKLAAGGTAVVQYDIPGDAWYFQANRQPQMPYAVLQEVALQSCGWLAAYCGAALTSPVDLRFRNLGGTAVQLAPVTAGSGTLTTQVRLTSVVHSGGLILLDYDFTVSDRQQVVLQGSTKFGFFTDEMMARQVGLRDVHPYRPSREEIARGSSFPYPGTAPYPDRQLRMIDHVELCVRDGGPHGLGIIHGRQDVDPEAWYFKAHFYQDPVCPGSLGLEALWQLLKVFAERCFGGSGRIFATPVPGKEHRWLYRGQIVPANARVDVQAVITARDERDRSLMADGWLEVDGLVIYRMSDFSLQVVE